MSKSTIFLLRRIQSRTSLISTLLRTLTTSSPHLTNSPSSTSTNPGSNQPASVAAKARSPGDTPNTDEQSSASKEEHKSGDDHPAKQPDPQAQPERTTGFGGGEGVAGGKEGLGERGDGKK